jgi:hypothetical protein
MLRLLSSQLRLPALCQTSIWVHFLILATLDAKRKVEHL